MEIRFSVLVVSIALLALNAAVQLSALAAVQGIAAQQHALAAQQHAVSPPTDAAALEIALNERRLAFVLATDAKFDQPTNPPTNPELKLHQPYMKRATNPWCSEWGVAPTRSEWTAQPELCNAANVVLMNDVEMVIEIAKKLVWKDDLKPVAVFGSKEAIFDNERESEIKKQHLLENYELKFDAKQNSGFIENHIVFEQRRYREASFHAKARLCGLRFSTTWHDGPTYVGLPIEKWVYMQTETQTGIKIVGRNPGTSGRKKFKVIEAEKFRRTGAPLYDRTVKWGS